MASSDLTRIRTNIQGMNILANLRNVNNQVALHQLRLGTGLRINNAEDDPAGLGVPIRPRATDQGRPLGERRHQARRQRSPDVLSGGGGIPDGHVRRGEGLRTGPAEMCRGLSCAGTNSTSYPCICVLRFSWPLRCRSDPGKDRRHCGAGTQDARSRRGPREGRRYRKGVAR